MFDKTKKPSRTMRGLSVLLSFGKWGGFGLRVGNYEVVFRLVIGWVSLCIFKCDLDYFVGATADNKCSICESKVMNARARYVKVEDTGLYPLETVALTFPNSLYDGDVKIGEKLEFTAGGLSEGSEPQKIGEVRFLETRGDFLWFDLSVYRETAGSIMLGKKLYPTFFGYLDPVSGKFLVNGISLMESPTPCCSVPVALTEVVDYEK